MFRITGLNLCVLALLTALGASGQMKYQAKIVIEGGGPLPTTPQIVVGLSHELTPSCYIYNIFGNGTISYAVNWRTRPFDRNTADVCPVVIRLKGYERT